MKTLFFIITVSIAVSYGWGMRGMIIGGERGAVLPGALLGMFLALFSGSELIAQNFFVFAAAGALGMAYGGFEPYADTMSFILKHDDPLYNPKKGYLGLMLKGTNWFGICGAVLGISFSSVLGGYYSTVSLVVFIALIPVMQAVGIKIFNKPFDRKNNIFPKIYISRDSREEWGGNLITLVCLLIFTLANRDFYAFFFSIVGIFGGAVGWCIAIKLYDFQLHPMKNGKYFFGKTQPVIDGWKIMEYSLGAFTGLCFAIYFFATKNTMLAERLDASDGVLRNSLGDKGSLIFAYVTVAVIFLTAIQYIDAKAIKKIPFRFFEVAERAAMFALPMIGVMLGSSKMSELVAFFMIVCFASEKVIFERSRNIHGTRKLITNIAFGIVAAAALITQIFVNLPPVVYILFYTFYYIAAENSTWYKKDYKGSRILVNAWFILQSLYLIAVILFI